MTKASLIAARNAALHQKMQTEQHLTRGRMLKEAGTLHGMHPMQGHGNGPVVRGGNHTMGETMHTGGGHNGGLHEYPGGGHLHGVNMMQNQHAELAALGHDGIPGNGGLHNTQLGLQTLRMQNAQEHQGHGPILVHGTAGGGTGHPVNGHPVFPIGHPLQGQPIPIGHPMHPIHQKLPNPPIFNGTPIVMRPPTSNPIQGFPILPGGGSGMPPVAQLPHPQGPMQPLYQNQAQPMMAQ